jgi:hypothetical protein
MKRTLSLSFLITIGCVISGCNNNAENKKNFEACVAKAELKYQIAHSSICIHKSWQPPGECEYDIESNNAHVRSKDNEINACALMYAPK